MPNPFDKAALAWTLPWDADWTTAVAFVGARRLAAGNNLGQMLVWELPEKAGGPAPKPLRRLDGHTNVISRLLGMPDGRTLLSASYDHSIRVWDLQAAGAGSETITLNAVARARADSPRGRASGLKLAPADDAKVDVVKPTGSLTGHREWVINMAMSRDGAQVLSGDDAGQVILWDRAAAKELRRWSVKGWAYGLALSADGKQAFVGERLPLVFDSGRHAALKIWDATTGKVRLDLSADKEFKGAHISAAAFSPDGKLLAITRGGEGDGKNWLLDAATGKILRELKPGHMYGATDLVFHPDGRHLATTGRDTVVRLWDTTDGKLVKELGKPRGGQFKDWFHAVSFSPDGRWLAAGDMMGAVQVWTLAG